MSTLRVDMRNSVIVYAAFPSNLMDGAAVLGRIMKSRASISSANPHVSNRRYEVQCNVPSFRSPAAVPDVDHRRHRKNAHSMHVNNSARCHARLLFVPVLDVQPWLYGRWSRCLKLTLFAPPFSFQSPTHPLHPPTFSIPSRSLLTTH